MGGGGKSDYVYILDPDDYFYDDESLEKFVKAVQEYPYDILMGSMQQLNEQTRDVNYFKFSKQSIKSRNGVISFLLNKSAWSAGNKIYRLEFLKNHRQVRYTGRGIAEDLSFNFKAFYFANSFCNIGDITYVYLLRQSSMSFTDRQNEAEEMLFRLEEVIEFHNRYRLNINQKQLEYFISKRLLAVLIVGYKFSSEKIIEIYKRSKRIYFSLFSDEQKAKMWFKSIRFECACLKCLFHYLKKKIEKRI